MKSLVLKIKSLRHKVTSSHFYDLESFMCQKDLNFYTQSCLQERQNKTLERRLRLQEVNFESFIHQECS